MRSLDELDYYEQEIVNNLVEIHLYTQEQAHHIIDHYQEVMSHLDRYWTPKDWAKILDDNYKDDVHPSSWMEHIQRNEETPIFEDEEKPVRVAEKKSLLAQSRSTKYRTRIAQLFRI